MARNDQVPLNGRHRLDALRTSAGQSGSTTRNRLPKRPHVKLEEVVDVDAHARPVGGVTDGTSLLEENDRPVRPLRKPTLRTQDPAPPISTNDAPPNDWHLEDDSSWDDSYYKHPEFYSLDDGIVFLVEETLYRLPMGMLGPSKLLDDVLAGNDSTGPVLLHQVSSFEMDSLLILLSARLIDDPPNFSFKQLCAILRLSNIWDLTSTRAYALREIEPFSKNKTKDPIDRIELAIKCHLEAWLETAYMDLCAQESPFSADQVQRLVGVMGFAGYAELASIREISRLSGENGSGRLGSEDGQRHLREQIRSSATLSLDMVIHATRL